MTPEYCVFVISRDKTATVAISRSNIIERLWNERYRYESQVNTWLRDLDSKPALHALSLLEPDYLVNCKAYASYVKKQLGEEGYTLLSTRDLATYDCGEKLPKPVYIPTAYGSAWFPSIRAAARAMGISHVALQRRLNRQDEGYKFS